MAGHPAPLATHAALPMDTTSASAPRFKVKLRLGGRPKSADGAGTGDLPLASPPAVAAAVPSGSGTSGNRSSGHQDENLPDHHHHQPNASGRDGAEDDRTMATSNTRSFGTPKSEDTTGDPQITHAALVLPSPAVALAKPPVPSRPRKRKSNSISYSARKMQKLNRTTAATGSILETAQVSLSVPVLNGSGEPTPSDSRQGTPLPGLPQSAAAAGEVFTSKDARPRKWKRTPVSLVTLGGGEMTISLWTTDEPQVFPSMNGASAAGVQEELASSLVGDLPQTPSAVASAAGLVAEQQTAKGASPKPSPAFDPSRPHACPYGESLGCLRAFPTKGKLATHILTVHGPKTHACESCPKKFASVMQLARHRKTHDNPAGRQLQQQQPATTKEDERERRDESLER